MLFFFCFLCFLTRGFFVLWVKRRVHPHCTPQGQKGREQHRHKGTEARRLFSVLVITHFSPSFFLESPLCLQLFQTKMSSAPQQNTGGQGPTPGPAVSSQPPTTLAAATAKKGRGSTSSGLIAVAKPLTNFTGPLAEHIQAIVNSVTPAKPSETFNQSISRAIEALMRVCFFHLSFHAFLQTHHTHFPCCAITDCKEMRRRRPSLCCTWDCGRRVQGRWRFLVHSGAG